MKQHKVKQREKKMNQRCLPIPSLNSRLVLAFKSQLKEMKNPMSIYSSFVSLSLFLSFLLSFFHLGACAACAASRRCKVQKLKSSKVKATGVLFFLEDGRRLRRKTAAGAPFLFSSFLDFFSSLSRLFLVSSFCEKREEREKRREREKREEKREERREERRESDLRRCRATTREVRKREED